MKRILAIAFAILTSTCLLAQTNLLIQTSEVHHLLQNYDSDRGSLMRFYTVNSSPERRERFKKFNEDYLQRLTAMNFDKISQEGKVDYILFKRRLQMELFNLKFKETASTSV